MSKCKPKKPPKREKSLGPVKYTTTAIGAMAGGGNRGTV